MNKTPFEKLEWIASHKDDNPRLSQINGDVHKFTDCDWLDDYLNKGELCLYWDLARYMRNLITFIENDPVYCNYASLESLYDTIDEMYDDIVQNDKWGFIYDW